MTSFSGGLTQVISIKTLAIIWLALISSVASPALATDIDGVQFGTLDQPRINAVFRRSPNGSPLSDPDLGFNVRAFFDTGASGLVVSQETALQLGLRTSRFPEPNGPQVVFSDIGVGGTEDFYVSEPVYVSIAPYHDVTDTTNLASYTQQFGPLRTQISQHPTPPELFEPVDIFGIPLMTGKVVVFDPTPVNPSSPNFPFETMRTYVYEPGTPYNPAQQATNPGIPPIDRTIKLSYASFERFTSVSPAGAPGATVRTNPFIGPNPVAHLDPNPLPDNTPGVTIDFGGRSSTGSWLLDTGAGSSFISYEQAGNIGVRYRPGTLESGNPKLETFDPSQPNLPGTLILDQFSLDLGGVGGIVKRSGFYLDSALFRTQQGNAQNDNDPNHLRYLNAPVLVIDVTVEDPLTQQTVTIDGALGVNYWSSSLSFTAGPIPDLTNLTDSPYRWALFDEPNGLFGLKLSDTPVAPANQWAVTSGGSWGQPSNWSDGVIPQGTSAVALLGNSLLSNGTVDLGTTDRVVKTLRFNNINGSYTVASTGGGKLVLQSASGPAAIRFDLLNSRNHTISAPIQYKSQTEIAASLDTMILTGGQTWDDNIGVSIKTGTVRFNLPDTANVSIGANASLSIDAGAELQLQGKSPFSGGGKQVAVTNDSTGLAAAGILVSSGDHSIGPLRGGGSTLIASGASLSALGIRQSLLTLQGAASQAFALPDGGSQGMVVLGGLSIAPDATLNMSDNDLVLSYAGTSPLAAVRKQILDGALNTPGQPRIAFAPGDGDRYLVAFDNALTQVSEWQGVPLSAPFQQIIASYTFYGDLNLDGLVDAADYLVIDNNFGSGTDWLTGDANLDGIVNAQDYLMVDNNFGKNSGSPLGSALHSVPEPDHLRIILIVFVLWIAKSLTTARTLVRFGKAVRFRTCSGG